MSSVVVYGGPRGTKRRRKFTTPSFRRTAFKRYRGPISRVRVTGGASRRYGRSLALRNLRTGGLLGIEKKFLDIPLTPTALVSPTDMSGGELPPSSIVTGCYSAPAQGDGPTNRDRNKIVITEYSFKGTIFVNSQTNQTDCDIAAFVFLAVIQDTQTNGAQLNSEDVWANPTANATACTNPFRNMSYTRRFRVLAMKRVVLRIPTITWDGTNLEQFGFNTPIDLQWRGKMPVTFTTGSTTADIANVTDNSIQLVGFTNSVTLAPQILGNTRIRFYG